MDIQKYNQRLLAVLGTLILVALSVILIISAIFFVVSLIEDASNDRIRDNALLIESPEERGAKIRKQEISFESPILIDTLQAIYIIPVSQVNLEEAEIIKESYALMDYEPRRYKSSQYRYAGRYNNLVVYDQKAGTKKLIFEIKMNIGSFQYSEIKGSLYVFMDGTSIDSNANQKLDDADLKSFLVYDVATGALHSFGFDNLGLTDYYPANDSQEIILSFVSDKDGNGEIDEYQEPTYLKSLSLADFQITDFIDRFMLLQIQQLVD